MLRPGDLVDHFKVVRLVGRGGMGEVYLARDTMLGRKVALKVVKPEMIGDEDAVERFLFEARVTARFSHPHIVAIHAVGEHAGCPYVALEYLEGQTLRERIADQRLGLRETLRIGLAIAEALGEAHSHDILHRDLKPENVLLPRDGRVRVVDFGLAKAIFSHEAEKAETVQHGMSMGSQTAFAQQFQTSGQGIAGTPLYMAPEQWLEQECTPATDVWALGVILYELFQGRRPLDAPTVFALCGMVCNMDAASPPLDAEGVPGELGALVDRCLSKEPTARPTTAELVDTLYRLVHGGGQKRATETSPFRGLLPFTERHADLFFGRDGEIGAFVERLRDEPVLPVVGPSGAGKSSFVQAGVIPRLREQSRWLVLTLRPGSDPFAALASRLGRGESGGTHTEAPTRATASSQIKDSAGAEVTSMQLAGLLREAPGRLALFLQQIAEQQQTRVLLLVDQLEELYTLVEDESERRRFMEAVCGAADDPEGPLRVVFTARDDFLGKLAESAAAREALSRVTVLRAPGPGAMREILTQPLAQAGYSYDDERLVDEMIAAVHGEAAGLPLLQFACAQLWERREKSGKLLTRAAYDSIGGVEGALAQHADGVFEGLTAADERLAREIFLRLVTGEGTRRTVSRGELLAGLGPGAVEVLDRLIQTRTVTLRKARKGDTDDAELELAHESLIRNWARLRRWIEESHENLTFLEEVGKAAELWAKRGRPADEAWTGEALHDALRKAERVERLPQSIADFLAAGRRRETRRVRRKRMMLATTIIALTIGAVVLGLMYREAQRERTRADEQAGIALVERSDALRDAAKMALEQGAPLEARAKLRMAIEGNDGVRGRALWSRLKREPRLWEIEMLALTSLDWSPTAPLMAVGLGGPRAFLDPRSGELFDIRQGGDQLFLHIAFAPDGKKLAGCGTHVAFWDVDTTKETEAFKFEDGFCVFVTFLPDGESYLTMSSAAVSKIWKRESNELIRELDFRATYLDYDVRSGLLLYAEPEFQGVKLLTLTAAGGEQPVVLDPQPSVTVDLDVGAKRAAVAHKDGTIAIWDTAKRKLLHTVSFPDGPPKPVRLHPHEPILAGVGADGQLSILNYRTGEVLERLTSPLASGVVNHLAFSLDGETLVVGARNSGELGAFRFDPQRGAPRREVHHGLWFTADADPRGELLATTVRGDPTILLWDAQTGENRGKITGHEGDVADLEFSPDGALLASASTDRSVRLWDPRSSALKAILLGHERGVQRVAFSRDGTLIATASDDATVKLWELSSGRELRVFVGHGREVGGIAFSPDGTELATSSLDHTVKLWDVKSGTLKATPITGLMQNFHDLAYHPSGKWLASAGADNALVFYDRETGETTVFEASLPGEYEIQPYYNEIEFSADGRLLGVCPGDTHQRRIWELDGKREIAKLRNHMGPGGSFMFSPDAAIAYAEDCSALRAWRVADGQPVWRAPALTPDPLRLLTHRGWIDPASGKPVDPPAAAAWVTAIEEKGRSTDFSDDGQFLCLVEHDGTVALWDLERDQRVARTSATAEAMVFAIEKGCVFMSNMYCHMSGGDVRMLTADGGEITIFGCPMMLTATDDEIFVSDKQSLRLFDTAGNQTLKIPLGTEYLAATRLGRDVVAATQSGEIWKLTEGDRVLDEPRLLATVAGAVGRRIEELIPGPAGTLLFTVPTGYVGVLHIDSGEVVDVGELRGRPNHALLADDVLYVTTVVGDHAVIDLTDYTREYCDLMREVWDEVPIVWEDGKAVLAEPPPDHPCVRPTGD